MNLNFDSVYYEPDILNYPLGKELEGKLHHLPWTEISSHNKIPEFQSTANKEFPKLKRKLIIGVRKTHKYVENHKVSDFLVPYTSSGCSAMCLYCYLVCNYNKCSYLRLFVNREQMMKKLIKTANNSQSPLTFEIGSNSDLILENELTNNLPWTIQEFTAQTTSRLTFPTKFHMIKPLLELDNKNQVIFRMSLNPDEIIRKVEIGTSPLDLRVQALNSMCEAGYPVGILLAPIILLPNWRDLYSELIEYMAKNLSDKVKSSAFIEIIFMTYSFVHNAINQDAFPNAMPIYNKELMTGRGRGKYCYKSDERTEAEAFLRSHLQNSMPQMPILYIV